jgi:hypothetical protein
MTPSAIHYEALLEGVANPENFVNQLADNLEAFFVYSLRHEAIATPTGLSIGTWGGRWRGFSVDEEDYTLTDNADNYLVVLCSDGVLAISTAETNWDKTSLYARVYKITTAGGVITAIDDHRAGLYGVHGPAPFVAPRVTSAASSATPTPNADTTDLYILTALAEGATFGAPTGSPVQGQPLLIRILDDGNAQTLAFNAIYRAIGVTLPTTTVVSKTLYLRAYFNSSDTKWDVVSVAQEA